ncbi:MAG: hypothetical protein LQ349_007470, partial [Xanthoria aureola]
TKYKVDDEIQFVRWQSGTMGRAPADQECRHVVDMSMMAVACVAEDTDSQDSGDNSRSSTNVASGNK